MTPVAGGGRKGRRRARERQRRALAWQQPRPSASRKQAAGSRCPSQAPSGCISSRCLPARRAAQPPHLVVCGPGLEQAAAGALPHVGRPRGAARRAEDAAGAGRHRRERLGGKAALVQLVLVPGPEVQAAAAPQLRCHQVVSPQRRQGARGAGVGLEGGQRGASVHVPARTGSGGRRRRQAAGGGRRACSGKDARRCCMGMLPGSARARKRRPQPRASGAHKSTCKTHAWLPLTKLLCFPRCWRPPAPRWAPPFGQTDRTERKCQFKRLKELLRSV